MLLTPQMMNPEELLLRLDLDDHILHVMEINFEERQITLLLDDIEAMLYVRLYGVTSFYTPMPAKQVFPGDKIQMFHWEKLPEGFFRIQLTLDIDRAKVCQNITIIFERIEVSVELIQDE